MENEDIRIKYMKFVQMISVWLSFIIILICLLKNKHRYSKYLIESHSIKKVRNELMKHIDGTQAPLQILNNYRLYL